MCTVEAMPLELQGRLPRRRRGPARRRPRARPRLHRPRAARARAPRDAGSSGPTRSGGCCAGCSPTSRSRRRPRLSTLRYAEPKRLAQLPPRSAVIAFSVRELYEVAARLRRERGGAALVFGALSPRTRNAQVGALPVGRGGPPRRHRRHRHGAEPRHRPRRLHRPRRSSTARARARSRPRRSARSPAAPAATRATAHFATTAELGRWTAGWSRRSSRTASRRSTTIYWRTDELDFFSPLSLLGSLDRQPPHPFLVRMRHAEDQRALAALAATPDGWRWPAAPSAVRLLWEVCQVPDFQSVADGGAHAAAGARLRFLRGPPGRIAGGLPGRARARARPHRRRRETLLGRIAGIRTWTYISNRDEWLPDPRTGRSARGPSRTGSRTRSTSGSRSSSWTGRAR